MTSQTRVLPPLLSLRPEGLYCAPGDFYIDPWRPVDRAVITHAHSDHARTGSAHYLAQAQSELILRRRLGSHISLQTLAYGEEVSHGGVSISLHPAGHVLGSAQVRLAYRGEVWVVSGDYKLQDDGTCAPFEPVPCDVFITESTFGLPIYRWPSQAVLMDDIHGWWQANRAAGRASVIYAYAFGKAQRLLHALDDSLGPVVCHGAVEGLNEAYRAEGVRLAETWRATDARLDKAALSTALVIAPPSAAGTPWLRRFGSYADAFASGWMAVRGQRRRRGVDRGFVMSDHADWPGLMSAIAATGAQQVYVTHGRVPVMVRWLQSQGLEAAALHAPYGDEEAQEDAVASVSSHGEPPDADPSSRNEPGAAAEGTLP